MKQCITCKQWKEETEFYRHSSGKLRNECKICHNSKSLTEQQKQNKSIYNKERYKSNREEILLKQKQYREEHKEEVKTKERKYNIKNKDRICARKIEYNRKYYEQHRDRILAKRSYDYKNTKYGIDKKIFNTLGKFFRNPDKSIERDLDFYGLNYNLSDVKIKFNILLQNLNLSYFDYGTCWELDHIIPRNQFHYTSPEDHDFKICWSLMNLRPILCQNNKSRPKDGSDVPEELKQKILGQKF